MGKVNPERPKSVSSPQSCHSSSSTTMICHMCESDSFEDGGDGFFYCLQCSTRLEGIIQTGVDGREVYRKQDTRPKPQPKFVKMVPSETTSYSGSGCVGPEVSRLGWGRWYTLRELEAATNGLCEENVIGEGGYGIVYSGILTDGTKVAVKNLLNNRFYRATREHKSRDYNQPQTEVSAAVAETSESDSSKDRR